MPTTYFAIATTINNESDPHNDPAHNTYRIARGLADLFAGNDSSFDPDQFLETCFAPRRDVT